MVPREAARGRYCGCNRKRQGDGLRRHRGFGGREQRRGPARGRSSVVRCDSVGTRDVSTVRLEPAAARVRDRLRRRGRGKPVAGMQVTRAVASVNTSRPRQAVPALMRDGADQYHAGAARGTADARQRRAVLKLFECRASVAARQQDQTEQPAQRDTAEARGCGKATAPQCRPATLSVSSIAPRATWTAAASHAPAPGRETTRAATRADVRPSSHTRA